MEPIEALSEFPFALNLERGEKSIESEGYHLWVRNRFMDEKLLYGGEVLVVLEEGGIFVEVVLC